MLISIYSRLVPVKSRGGWSTYGSALTQLVLKKLVSGHPETHAAVSYPFTAEFDKTFGPILMVTYACLSNTLLLTGASLLRDNTVLVNAQAWSLVLVSVRPST